MKCRACQGTGRYYSVALYDGVAECGACQGSGIDPDTPCPAECGLTYGQHLDRDEVPEDCSGEEAPRYD